MMDRRTFGQEGGNERPQVGEQAAIADWLRSSPAWEQEQHAAVVRRFSLHSGNGKMSRVMSDAE